MKPAKFIILCLGLLLLSVSLWSEVQRTVDPLIQPIWHQTNPWNGRCPGTGTNRAHAGSHALALAKTMKYWAYPTYGVGSVSYVDDDYGPINQVFTGELAWNNMSNNLVFQTTLRYIALCGAATYTNYELDYSTSTLADIQYALLNYFTYDSGMQYRNRAENTNFYWKSLIRGELDASRPVIYSAQLANGNEVAFIIDGYNEAGLFHINWSDVNNADSWVDLNTLSVGGQNIANNNQHMLTGVRPSLGPANIDESFETDFSNFNWQFAGQANWTISTEAAYFGTQAAKSGNISDNQTTSLFIQINVTQADTISFYKKVSCEVEPNNLYDHLAFWIDNVEQERWSGDGQWAYHEYSVSSGVHQFRWVYNKDGASDYFGDCAWIDAIDLPEGTTPLNPPQFLEAELIGDNDIQVNWSLPNGANTTLQGYKVYRNGVELLQYSNPNMTSYNDYNLPNGDYTYTVRGVYTEGLSGYSNSSTITVEIPYAPMNLTATLNGVNSGLLQWQAPPLLRHRVLMGYQVYRDNVLLAQIENPDDLNYLDTGLAQGVYFYEVTAMWQVGESPRSNVAQLAVGVPEPPANVRASVSGSTVILSWNQVSEPQFVTGFKVYRNGALLATIINPTQLSYTDAGLPNGVYNYYVRAIYTDAESGNSAVAQAVVQVPYPPVNVVAVVTGDDVQLTWSNPELVRSLTHYVVYRNGQIIAAVYNPNTTNYLDQNLPNGVHTYQLSAFYAGVESPLSAPVTAVVEILYPPTALTASVNLADVTLHWTLPANQGGLTRSFNGYNVYRDNVLVAFVPNNAATQYTDLNLANGSYNYALSAVYTIGESTLATLNNVLVQVLYPVTELNYVLNGDDVSLSWTAAANSPTRETSGQRTFMNYKVYKNGNFLAETTQLNYTDADLPNGLYQYYITAVYSNGEAVPSPLVNVEVEVPYPPTALVGTVVWNDVMLSWTAPLSSGGLDRAFSGYQIFRDGSLLNTSAQTAYTDNNVPNGVYYYQVYAVYAAGLSQPTNTVEARVEVLYPPQDLSRTVSNRNNVTLNWVAASSTGDLRALIGYKVYRNNTLLASTPLLTYADAALADGNYIYYVTAYYDNGESQPTNSVAAFIQYPYPPLNVTATVAGANVQLSWDAVTGTGVQYQLFRNGTLLATQAATTYADNNLANGSYAYYLITLNASDSGLSDPSATVSATVNVPYPPQNLMGQVISDAVLLSWTAPLTGPRVFVNYHLYRNGAYLGNSNETTYTDADLTNGSYAYFVTAQYDTAESIPTNTVNLLVEVLYPPTALTHSVSSDDVTLTWTAAATSGGLRDFQGYKVYRDGSFLAETMQTAYTDNDLANGTYQYYVTAVYLTGTSAPTNTVTASVEVLYPPTGLSFVIADDDIALTWQMPVTTGGLRNFTGFNLYRNGTLLSFVPETTFTDAGLANGSYQYYVTALYSSGESAFSNTVTANLEVLYPATNLVYQVSGDDVSLSWTAAATSGGLRNFIGYKVMRDNVQIALTQVPSYLDANLANGTYVYQITAVYSSGESTPTAAVNVLVEVLYAPSGLAFSVYQNTVTLVWTAAPTSARALTGYNVYRDGSLHALVTGLNYVDSNLANGIYHYYVTAVYGSGESAPSNTVSPSVEVLYPASNLSYSVTDNDVTLSWNAAPSSGGLRSFLHYAVYRNAMLIAETPSLTFTDSNLPNGTYAYYAAAVYSSGTSTPTNTVNVLVEVLYPPTALAYSINNTAVTLTWTAAAASGGLRDFQGYKIYRDGNEIAQTPQITFTDLNLANGTYQYYVTAVYLTGTSTPTNTVTASVEVLYPPTGLTYSINADAVYLEWIVPLVSARNHTGYQLYRNGLPLAQTLTASYTDQNLNNGSYTYYVTALYSSGQSLPTNSVTAIIEVPYVVTNLSAAVLGDAVTLNWVLPATGPRIGLTGFFIYRNNALYQVLNNPATTSWTDGGLANGEYAYYLVAVYGSGMSLPSNTVFASINVMPDLPPPTGFTATAIGERNVYLAWNSPSANVLAYFIYRNNVLLNTTLQTNFTDFNLSNGSYRYYLKAQYAAGMSSASDDAIVNIMVASPPTSLTATVQSGNNVLLNWQPPFQNEIGFTLYRNGVELVYLPNPASSQYLDSALANGSYTYQVAAVYPNLISTPTNPASVNIAIVYAPSDLISNLVENDVQLTWNAVTDLGGFVAYKIWRDGSLLTTAQTNSYLDADLANGTYSYWVTAQYASGESLPTNTVTVPLMIYYVPTGVTASIQNQNDVYVSWDAPGQSATGYVIYLNSSVLVQIDDPSITNYLDEDRTNGSYTYRVAALYAGQQSSPSSPASATIIVPHPPTNLTAVVSGNSVQLNWTAPADSWGITRYYITFKKNSSPWLLVSILANFTSFIQPDLPNATYQIYVRASYSTTPPQYSEPTDTLEAVVNIPYVPQNLTGVLLGTTANLSWQAPDDSTGLTGYSILRNNNPIATVTTSTYQDENLPNGDYSYRVCSIYGTDVSIPSTAVALAVWLTYSPSNLTGVAQDNAVSLSWDPPSDTGGFTSYMVQRNEQPIAYTADTVFNDLNIPNGQYQYRIVAGFSFGNSQPSNTYAASISVPHPPVNLRGNVAGNSVHLQWGPPLDATNLSSYRIYRNQQFLAEVNTLIYTDSGLANGDYTYYVQAYYGSLPSSPTASVAMHVEMAYVPSGFAVSATGNNVELTWNAVSDAGFFQYYKVYRNSELLATTPAINYSDPDLANGSYTYAVSAFYQTLESHITVPVEIAINIAYPAQNVSAVAEQETVLVSWNAPLSYGQPDAYKVWFMREGQQLAPQNWVFVADADTVLNVQTTLAADLAAGKYLWAVVALYGTITAEPAFSNTITVTPPEVFTPPVNKLVGNYPNPFNPDTNIVFWLYRTALVRLEIYNERGQLVRNLYKGSLAAGEHSIPWNGTNDAGQKLGSGIYICKLTAPDSHHIRKLMLVK